jgi:hypothetical protein
LGAGELIVAGCSAAVVLSAWLLPRRRPLPRAAIGVVGWGDVLLMLALIVGAPYLYRALPEWTTALLLSLVVTGTLLFVFRRAGSPLLLAGGIAVVVVLAEVAAAVLAEERSNAFLLLNSAALGLLAVAWASILVGFGMRARHLAALAGALAIYDAFALSALTLWADLLDEASGEPFAPLIGWWENGDAVAIGFPDLLLAAIFPLVAHKAFGGRAGALGLVASLTALGVAAVAEWPATILLGPLVVAHCIWWSRRRGGERRMWEYLRDEPVYRAASQRELERTEPVLGREVKA